MKYSVKKSALTALICLALSSSALAMPTDGTVASGTITVNGMGQTSIATVASGATIAATGNSIINWGDFGIKAGETLNFNTAGGAILNRVTGANVSEIYGALNQTGENALFVVNPNGITIGSGASIDAVSLVLSTLAISDDNFTAIAETGVGSAFKPEGKTTAAALNITGDAKFDIDHILVMAGGTVNVDENVSFTTNGYDNGIKNAYLSAIAADELSVNLYQFKDYPTFNETFTKIDTTTANKVNFHGQVTNNGDGVFTQLGIAGGTVNLDNAKFTLNNCAQLYVGAGDFNKYDATATAANTITAKNLTINNGQTVYAVGGSVALTDSTIKQVDTNGGENEIVIIAAKQGSVASDNNTSGAAMLGDADSTNTVTLTGTTLTSPSLIDINGGAVSIENKSTLTAKETSLYVGTSRALGANDTNEFAATAANALKVADSELSGTHVALVAGKAELSNATVKASDTFDALAANKATVTTDKDSAAINSFVASGTADNELTVTDSNLTYGESIMSAGKVAITNSTIDGALEIHATNSIEIPNDEADTVIITDTDEKNSITLDKATVNATDMVDIIGGAVTVKNNSNITVTKKTENDENELRMFAVKTFKEVGEDSVYTANDANVVNVTGSKVAANFVSLKGGKITAADSTVEATEELEMLAATKINNVDADKTKYEFAATPDNAVKVTGSTLTTKEFDVVAGSAAFGKTAVDASDRVAVTTATFLTDKYIMNDATNTKVKDESTTFKVADSNITSWTIGEVTPDPTPTPDPDPDPQPTPTPEPTPTPDPDPQPTPTPEPTPEVPDTPALDAKDETNIASGKQAMSEIIASNSTLNSRAQAAGELVRNINAAAGSERAKAAQVLGMLNRIDANYDNYRFDDATKNTMRQAILDNYAPVRSGEQVNENTLRAVLAEADEVTVDTVAAEVTAPVVDDAAVTVEQ